MRKFLIFFILMLLNVRVWSTLSIDNGLKITFFDVGQGDAVLFEFPNGKTMLVDAGDRNDYFDCGESIIYPYLVRYGIRKIDVFLLSHAHNDHIGGALTLLEKKYFKKIVKTHVQQNSRMDVMLEEMARRFDVPVHYVQVGDTLCIDPEVLLLVLHPTPGFIKNAAINSTGLNDASIVFKCIYHNHAILMTGDAEIPSEQSMLRYDALLSSSLTKLAHHGSHTAGSPSFRRAVGADVGIVSVAAFNRFGLPSKYLLQSYEKEGTDIFVTSEHGAVQFLIKPDSYKRIVKKKWLLNCKIKKNLFQEIIFSILKKKRYCE